eukprot:SAG31_NODE_1054_length_10140_cov_4.264316_7_plen_76_part_00
MCATVDCTFWLLTLLLADVPEGTSKSVFNQDLPLDEQNSDTSLCLSSPDAVIDSAKERAVQTRCGTFTIGIHAGD